MTSTWRKKIIFLVVAVALVAVFLAGTLSEYGTVPAAAVQAHHAYQKQCANEDETGWVKAQADQKVIAIKNDRFILQLDTKTTRFTVTDLISGNTYASYPEKTPNLMSDEDAKRAGSNLGIVYYDRDSKIQYFGSGPDAVQKNQVAIYQKDQKIRVIYTVGSATNNSLAPAVISQQVMEQQIFPKLKAFEKVKLKLYYKLYAPNEKPDDYEEKMKAYPALKDKAAYILTNDVTEQILDEISAAMKKTGFTKAAADAQMKALGVSGAATELPAGFQIPLELAVDESGFSARVLTDRITENNSSDKLTGIYLLEYFGARGAEDTGFFLVPDGSGAQIALNQAAPQSYQQHLYNEDLLIATDQQTQLSRNAPLPYFGLFCKKGSFLATVEAGAGVGTVMARTMGKANPLNMANVFFDLRSFDQTDIGKKRSIPTLNVYNGHFLMASPKVHYTLLPDGQDSLSSMAAAVRNRLDISSAQNSQVQSNGSLPLYLDFLCLSTKQVDVVGISVQKKVTMSTITEIIEVVQKLHAAGITNLQVRLKGWTEEGLRHSAFDSCRLSKKVGTTQQLEQLRSLLTQKGGALWLDTDFSFAQSNKVFDGVKTSRDTARNLERAVASLKFYNPVTLQQEQTLRQGYVISPYSWLLYTQRFLDGYQTPAYQKLGLSWSAGGMYLTGDYNTKTDLDMDDASVVAASVFQKLKSSSAVGLLTDYGYAYTLPYVTGIINCPITSSYYTAETASVPFYQMVLGGFKQMTGAALNFTGTRSQLVEMAATASAPYYLLMTADDGILQDLELQEQFYSLDEARHLTDMISDYKIYSKAVGSVFGQEITSFSWVNDTVSKTTFANGKVMLVNRGETAVETEGVTLPAYSYQLVG